MINGEFSYIHIYTHIRIIHDIYDIYDYIYKFACSLYKICKNAQIRECDSKIRDRKGRCLVPPGGHAATRSYAGRGHAGSRSLLERNGFLGGGGFKYL